MSVKNLLLVMAVLIAINILLYLVRPSKDPSYWNGRYSADFRVGNRSDLHLIKVRFENYGWACPLAGVLGPSEKGYSGSIFPAIKSHPEVVVVTWFERDLTQPDRYATVGEMQSQEILMKGVVPRGVPGLVIFEFTKERRWTVSFEPRIGEN